jgi:hypothetical protein
MEAAMTKDFVAIFAAALMVDIGVWSLRGDKHAASPEPTETVRAVADNPALKLTSEQSPYMRNER